MNEKPLTRRDFDNAARVLQRMIAFRDAEDGRPSGTAGVLGDRSQHLRKSVATVTLFRDSWSAPEQPRQQQRHQGRRR